MEPVKNIIQIKTNIKKLEAYRSGSSKYRDQYLDLIALGICFLPYKSKTGLAFAPSRFIGYANNNLKDHKNNESKDGKITNRVITNILGVGSPLPDVVLQEAYINFCKTQGRETKKRGTERKYWVTSDILDFLEDEIEFEIIQSKKLKETEKQQLITARIGQGCFREELIKIWRKCCVTGCDHTSILRASHIKPWYTSTNEERIDKFNGLLLSPNMDALFDNGLISFKDSGEMLISSAISKLNKEVLFCSDMKIKIKLQPEHIKYVKWHRENIYKKSI